jgi:murein DD-endopeptidase MepM/ murein hydrolase activator NlpD
MTITALPFRTAIAVVVIAVFAAISITPTHAGDTTPEPTTTTGAADAESTTTAADATPMGDAESTTTTAPESSTTTVAATSTTTTVAASTTTTTVADTTTTTVADTTTTVAASTTTTTVAPPPPITTTTTVPPEPEVDELDQADADFCDPETTPTGVDTEKATSDESTSTGTTTTVAEETDTVDGEESINDADVDPCNPPEEDEVEFTPVDRIRVVRDIVFPIVGRAGYYDGFGACRDGCAREHHGIDIGTYGWKGLPVVASHDGTVVRTTYDQRLAGCAVILVGDDGWESRYVHLNTDFPGTDRSGYNCLAPGIEVGTEVTAGQIIGWVGDSGNAENTIPHIHFEIRNPAGVPVNAYDSLEAARTIEFDWLSQDPSDAYNSIVAANYTNSAATAVIIPATEARKISADENAASAYDNPVIVIDKLSPDSALEQIERLELDRAIVMSDQDSAWILELVAPLVDVVESAAFPLLYSPPLRMMPDSGDTEPPEPNPIDRFATIIVRSAETDADPDVEDNVPAAADTDSDSEAIVGAAEAEAEVKANADAGYLEAFEEYTVNHRSVVLSAEAQSMTDLTGVGGPTPASDDESRASALKVRRASDTESPPTPLPLWWNTGDGWVWTYDPLDMPSRGIVYLTDAQANPWTLAFLTSLVEADAVPLWRG